MQVAPLTKLRALSRRVHDRMLAKNLPQVCEFGSEQQGELQQSMLGQFGVAQQGACCVHADSRTTVLFTTLARQFACARARLLLNSHHGP